MTEWQKTPSAEGVSVRILSNYPGLVISSDGRVQGPSGTWLKPSPVKGYPSITYGPRANKRTLKIHVLVCLAFHGPKPSPDHEVCHKNGNRQDNRASNLRWGTQAENMADRDAHGRTARGVRHGRARLSEEDVRAIWSQPSATTIQLAAEYGIHRTVIGNIRSGKRWGHLS